MDLAWVDRWLPAARTGAVEVFRDRPWSMVARVPTAAGPVYFKENRGGTRYEAALAPALARWVPDRVLTPIAADVRRGWTLLPDGGPILRDGPPARPRWERMLRDHAQFQRDLTAHVDELLALGVPDLRPSALPDNLALLPPSAVLETALPALRALNDELAAGPVPLSLQHDDLHDGNVFADGRVFDWGPLPGLAAGPDRGRRGGPGPVGREHHRLAGRAARAGPAVTGHRGHQSPQWTQVVGLLSTAR